MQIETPEIYYFFVYNAHGAVKLKKTFFFPRNFDFLIPDAPELISNFLEGEQDMSCKRNAFMMLIHADQERALNYLSTCIDQVNSFGDILQLVIVELIYKVWDGSIFPSSAYYVMLHEGNIWSPLPLNCKNSICSANTLQ